MDARNRVIIEKVEPTVDSGRFYAKTAEEEIVKISADIFSDGHDVINASFEIKYESQKNWKEFPLIKEEQDNWSATFEVAKPGNYQFRILGWVDHALNWQHNIKRKIDDDQKVTIELLDGVQYLDFVDKKANKSEKQYLSKLAKSFKSEKDYEEAITQATAEELKKLFLKYPHKEFVTKSATFNLFADRKKGVFSSWYEFFPRSAGKGLTHGTFKDCENVLPEVAKMGFDVVYFPPIHPIGEDFRKGKNNTTKALKGDVGSPWAIGGKAGGHKDIHPELGSLADFKALIKKANSLGIEIAMDYALQCAPNHPYVKEHPQWFKWRPDGTVQYAENPPKKYQDILPISFETSDWKNLWEELKSILEYWIAQGIKIFRVDNPHTKAFVFWVK